MSFIPFMLCERLTDPRRLEDRHYIAEPKLGGQRAQLHVREGRAIACYSRHGLDLLRHAGMAWLRKLAAEALRQNLKPADRGRSPGVSRSPRRRPLALWPADVTKRAIASAWAYKRDEINERSGSQGNIESGCALAGAK